MRALILLLFTSVAAANNQYPAISPDGSRIAFVSDRDGTSDLYVMDVDGTHVVRLTQTAEQKTPPAWSADGKSVTFAVQGVINVVDLHGTVAQIGKVPGRALRVSPDRKRAFYALGTWTEVQLMESDLDGANAKPITDGKSVVWTPRVSPDGKTIAFTGRDADKQLHVYLMDPDGSNVRQLTRTNPPDGQIQSPSWSPDGKRIAVQASSKERAHIYLVDAKTGEMVKLAEHEQAWHDETPAWFPDGKRLAIQSDRTGSWEIWTMKTDGSELHQVTSSNPR
jgi:Tol biopolymer transport system component